MIGRIVVVLSLIGVQRGPTCARIHKRDDLCDGMNDLARIYLYIPPDCMFTIMRKVEDQFFN